MSNCNQINTTESTAADLRLPYKQEVGGSSPSAPTIPQSLTPPNVKPDPLPEEGSGSLSETLTGQIFVGAVERYRAVVLTACTKPGPHGTETRLPHEQATFVDPVTAGQWLEGRVGATGKDGVLLVQREELIRWYKPEVSR